MASTYTPIATYTTPNSSSTSYTFSSISGAYTDLVLVAQLKETSLGSLVYRVNSDSGSNYSTTYLDGNGTSATSGRWSSQTIAYATYEGVGTGFGTYIFNFNNYSNTSTYKTVIGRASNAGNSAEATVSLWRSTSAITSISLFAGTYFDTGCTFTLYGIKAA